MKWQSKSLIQIQFLAFGSLAGKAKEVNKRGAKIKSEEQTNLLPLRQSFVAFCLDVRTLTLAN